VTPEEAGLPRAEPAALKGGEPRQNAEALITVLDGAPGAYRDIALINAGAALIVAGKAGSLKDGVALGDAAIRSGAARRTLDRLIAVSNA
jgi:anthranilate phosphoribosyltransferase